MINSRADLISTLEKYHSFFADENQFQKQFLELLKHPSCFFRDHLPGHITGSAWIVDETKQFTLLTHHAKLNRWLQPGGHADGEENVLNVALREAREETGLTSLKPLQNTFFDIDIHMIPAGKDFPQHLHYDLRFLITASKNETLIITEESHDLAWIKLNDLSVLTENNSSILRMAEKTRMLL